MLYVKKIAFPLCIVFMCVNVFAQDNALLLKEAQNLELKFDEAGALDKYKQVVINDGSNIQALVKCTELNCSIGSRQKDKAAQQKYFTDARNYAQQAFDRSPGNADACYAMALVSGKMTSVDDDTKQVIEDVKQIKIFADNALALNPNHAKANYIMGKWHFELIRLGWLKRAAIKTFYGGIPDTQIDSAAYYMEKCRTLEPYFALNYLDLAKVYAYDHQPNKAIEVLNKLVKLPNRTYDDPAIKEEGKKMLATMQ